MVAPWSRFLCGVTNRSIQTGAKASQPVNANVRLYMSTYRFSTAEKFGVWDAHGGVCFWCGEPLEFRHSTVDHILPEVLEKNKRELASVIESFGLPPEFQINDFSNWVPAHSNCNSKKNKTVFAKSPVFIASLEYASRRAPRARAIFGKVAKNRKKGKVLAMLEDAATEGLVTQEDIKELFGGLEPIQPIKTQQPLSLRISSRWTVVQQNGAVAFVTNGVVGGYTTLDPNPDPSFICPFCSQPGPWNGVVCLSCNRISDPAD